MNFYNIYKLLAGILVMFILVFFPKFLLATDNQWEIYRKIIINDSLDYLLVNPIHPDTIFAVKKDTVMSMLVIKSDVRVITKSVLAGRILNKLMLNPWNTKEIYACTDQGLFLCDSLGGDWLSYNDKFSNSNIVDLSFGFDEQLPKLIATNYKIFKREDKNWIPLKLPSNLGKIQSIICCPGDSAHHFFVGTNHGIYKFAYFDAGVKQIGETDCPIESIIGFSAASEKLCIIYAITESNNIYFIEATDNTWRPLNYGLDKISNQMDKVKSCFYAIATDPKRPYTVFITTRNNQVLDYNLSIPKAALIVFYDDDSPHLEWEYQRISDYINLRLKSYYYIKKIDNFSENLIQLKQLYNNQYNELNKLYGFDLFILCKIHFRMNNYSLNISPRLYDNINRKCYLDSTIYEKHEEKANKYYPKMLDKVVNIIVDKIIELNLMERRKNRIKLPPWVIGVSIGGVAIGISYFIIDRFKPESLDELPDPPIFPIHK